MRMYADITLEHNKQQQPQLLDDDRIQYAELRSLCEQSTSEPQLYSVGKHIITTTFITALSHIS